MNCTEAEVYVSALNDGEAVPSDAVQHITACEQCRETMREYSRMGAELRLAGAQANTALPPLRLPARVNWLDVLFKRVAVPRFALVGLFACLLLSTGAVSLIRAQQSRQLWFQFGYTMTAAGDVTQYIGAKAGYDETGSSISVVNGEPVGFKLRVRVESISEDSVVLRCRAVVPKIERTANGFTLTPDPPAPPSLDGVAEVRYKPGESLPIPIEGGGTLYLKGDVMDHQPKIAFGTPLEPAADHIVVRSPVLVGPNGLIATLGGGSSYADVATDAIFVRGHSEPAFVFAGRPFPGAVKGEANWGQITFRMEGKDYRLVAAAPVAGGDQPRPIWVARDAELGKDCGGCIGAEPIPK